MQAYLAQYFPLGMADVGAGGAGRWVRARWGIVCRLARLIPRRRLELCPRP